MVCEIIESVNKKAVSQIDEPSDKDDTNSDDDAKPQNKGKLLVDATCSPADITFPTDLKLLNKAREKSEQIIDVLHYPHKGKMIRKQIGYVSRNLKTIKKLSKISSLNLLNKHQYKNLLCYP